MRLYQGCCRHVTANCKPFVGKAFSSYSLQELLILKLCSACQQICLAYVYLQDQVMIPGPGVDQNTSIQQVTLCHNSIALFMFVCLFLTGKGDCSPPTPV